MRTRKWSTKGPVIALAAFAITSACKVGPNYSKPKVPAAPAYTEGANWKPAQPADATLRGAWWELFEDAELTALEEQVAPANPTVQAAEASFRQARAFIKFNRSSLFPTLTTGPNFSTNRISANNPTLAPGREFGLFQFPVTLSYEADLWGRIRRSIEAAREQYQASAADLENVKLSLASELAVNYFEARSLDAQKEILENTKEAFQRALQLTQNRFNGGVASKAEVAQAETQLRQTEAQAIDVGVARAAYEHSIAVLTGRNPEGYKLAPRPLRRTPPAIPTGVPSQLLERRPDIAIAERQMAAANEQIGIAKAAFYPSLLITATGGFQSGSIVDWFSWPSRYWAVGPQMLQTIFDAGRRRSTVENAQAGYDGAVAMYRQAALTAFREVEDNLAALRILSDEAAKQHEATLAAENSQQLALNRYKGGLVTYLEVITAQSIALTNKRVEVDIMRQRMNASVLLVRALGGGWDTSKLPPT